MAGTSVYGGSKSTQCCSLTNATSPEVPLEEGAGGSSAARDEGDDDVGGVPVEVLSPAVVNRRSPWVGVAGCDLDIPQRHAGVEGGLSSPRSIPWPSLGCSVGRRTY